MLPNLSDFQKVKSLDKTKLGHRWSFKSDPHLANPALIHSFSYSNHAYKPPHINYITFYSWLSGTIWCFMWCIMIIIFTISSNRTWKSMYRSHFFFKYWVYHSLPFNRFGAIKWIGHNKNIEMGFRPMSVPGSNKKLAEFDLLNRFSLKKHYRFPPRRLTLWW